MKLTYFWYSGHIWKHCWHCALGESWGQLWAGGAQGCGGWVRWGTWDNQPLPGTPGWGKEQRSRKGTASLLLLWFKAGSIFPWQTLFVHGGDIQSWSWYTCSRTPSVQIILRSLRMSGWDISRKTARIQKWWDWNFAFVCSFTQHKMGPRYSNGKRQCAWQVRKVSLAKQEIHPVEVRPRMMFFFLRKFERCFANWLWLFLVVVIFGFVCNPDFHGKVEAASREFTVTALVQSPAYGAITFVITIVIVINSNAVVIIFKMIASRWSLGGEAWVEAQAGAWTGAWAGNL